MEFILKMQELKWAILRENSLKTKKADNPEAISFFLSLL